MLVLAVASLIGACSSIDREARSVVTLSIPPAVERPSSSAEPVEPNPLDAISASPAQHMVDPPAPAEPKPNPAPPPPLKTPTIKLVDLLVSPGHPKLERAASLLAQARPGDARRALLKVIAEIDESATLDVRLAAHALLGRTCASLRDTACAKTQFDLVTSLWRDPIASTATLEALGGDDEAKQLRLGRALAAVSEAVFHVFERKQLSADPRRAPA